MKGVLLCVIALININNKIFSIFTITPLKIIKSFLILLYHLYSGFQMAIYCLFLNCITSNNDHPWKGGGLLCGYNPLLLTRTSRRWLSHSFKPLGIPFFFADAYSYWQRGSNENSNGLLREYFPKKTDLVAISDEALNKALYDINHRPRKCLAYRTACEALEDEFK